jgi:hypothetical protein
MRDIFDTLFGTKKPPQEKGDDPTRKSQINIIFPSDQKTQVKVNDPLELKAKITKVDGTPLVNTKVRFIIDNTNFAEFVGTKDKTIDTVTDSSGLGIAKIKGVTIGKVSVTATVNTGDLELSKNISIDIV